MEQLTLAREELLLAKALTLKLIRDCDPPTQRRIAHAFDKELERLDGSGHAQPLPTPHTPK